MVKARKIGLLLLTTLLLVGTSVGLAGCRKSGPKTHAVKKWSDVQNTINNAKSNDIVDLSGLSTPTEQQTIELPSGINLVIKGNSDVVFVGVAVTCLGENTLTIENLRLLATENQQDSTINFVSYGNQLVLAGENEVIYAQTAEKSGAGAAIGVPEGTTLTISGIGKLTAVGGTGGAGIGGGFEQAAGTIIVREGTVVAYGGSGSANSGGAGVGGGARGGGGNTTISGGTVTAVGGNGSAGFGRGAQAEGDSAISISAGEVIAISGDSSDVGAINSRIEALPGFYSWWASGSKSIIVADEGRSFPEDPFSNASNYHYVRIRSR